MSSAGEAYISIDGEDIQRVRIYEVSLEASTTYWFQGWLPSDESSIHIFRGFKDPSYYCDGNEGSGEPEAYEDTFTRYYASELKFTPKTSGTYYVVLGDYGNGTPLRDPSRTTTGYVYFGTKKADEPRVTTTWYDGKTIMCQQDLLLGQTLPAIASSKAGKTFWGWFKEASFTTPWQVGTGSVGPVETQVFGKYTSNDARLRGVRGSTGRPASKFNPSKSRSTFIVGKNKSKVRIVPLKKNAQATTYIKVGSSKYKKASSVTLKLKRGQKKYLKVKVVSQTGSKYTRTYTVAVRRR